MLLSFQRPSHLSGRGFLPRARPRTVPISERTGEYSARPPSWEVSVARAAHCAQHASAPNASWVCPAFRRSASSRRCEPDAGPAPGPAYERTWTVTVRWRGTVVEVDQHDLLPGAERRAAVERPGSSPRVRSSRRAGGRGRWCRGCGGCARSRPRGGISRSSSAWRSWTPPGSYSIVVMATVDPVANTVTTPRSTPAVGTTLSTPGVMSTMCPFPGVSIRSRPPWTVIGDPASSSPGVSATWTRARSGACRAGGPCRRPRPPAGRAPRADRLAVEPDSALGEGAPGLGSRDPERAREQRRQMDVALVPPARPRSACPPEPVARCGPGRTPASAASAAASARGTAQPAPGPAPAWRHAGRARAAARSPSSSSYQDGKRGVGDAQRLAVHLLGRLGDPDVVAVATSTSCCSPSVPVSSGMVRITCSGTS